MKVFISSSCTFGLLSLNNRIDWIPKKKRMKVGGDFQGCRFFQFQFWYIWDLKDSTICHKNKNSSPWLYLINLCISLVWKIVKNLASIFPIVSIVSSKVCRVKRKQILLTSHRYQTANDFHQTKCAVRFTTNWFKTFKVAVHSILLSRSDEH